MSDSTGRVGRILRGVGVGFRPELAADLLADPRCADFLEMTAEAISGQSQRVEAVAMSRMWPVALHGVKLSLGDPLGLDSERLSRLGLHAQELNAEVISEHVAITRARGRELGHLTQVPMTMQQVSVVVNNTDKARRALPDRPFLLENIAWTVRWPEDSLEEGDFYSEIASRTGCDLLLDVGNLFGNAVNSGRDPLELLARYPLDRVAMLHLAGGVFEDGFYFDTHAHPLLEAHFELLSAVLDRVGDVPMVLERDGDFSSFGALAGELSRARSLLGVRPSGNPRRSEELPTRQGTRNLGVPLDARLLGSWCQISTFWKKAQGFSWSASDSEAEEEAYDGTGVDVSPRRSTSEASASPHDNNEASAPRSAKNTSLLEELSLRHAHLAELLTRDASPTAEACFPFAAVEVHRARSVLVRKRVDDALPLLGELSRRAEEIRPLAYEVLGSARRPENRVAVHDAFLLCDAAICRRHFEREALLDRAVLRARFVRQADGPQPRALPAVIRERTSGGEVFWALKGPGTTAPVRCWHR